MMSLALVSMLLLVQADVAVSQARRAYGDCLTSAVRSHLDKNSDPAAFDGALAGACAAQAAALRNAILASEKAAGSSDTDAEELAQIEIEDFETNTKDVYRLHLEQNTRPR